MFNTFISSKIWSSIRKDVKRNLVQIKKIVNLSTTRIYKN